ncbi:hypothetical protein [Streptomyces laurentii]|uniref:hypothetical protein n=1 Tax=Streptomyces laurentii TaxID=39478 RepID=UPI003692C336
MTLTRIAVLAAATVLSLGTLVACGTENTGNEGGAPPGSGTGSVRATPATVPPATDPGVEFMKMLIAVGRPCHPDLPTEPPEPPASPGEEPARTPGGPLPTDEHPPGPPAPATPATPSARPASPVELDPAQRCEARQHVRRITKELDALPDPTPARVRAALNKLGYTDGRIHGLERAGGATRFVLDLRLFDDPLCLSGSVKGGTTAITAFGVSADADIEDVKRPG